MATYTNDLRLKENSGQVTKAERGVHLPTRTLPWLRMLLVMEPSRWLLIPNETFTMADATADPTRSFVFKDYFSGFFNYNARGNPWA